ncbi:PLD nuclease N-terminal domain-containing protein [Devriesea agamarum]|uniref:PLD nuclease N-terminal domain-containing protein n=1 Tax=Devriesea agamarum TaxID=472569 RepID=UPI00071C9707|nr:PLD nuclease N-terminal domain-containing protein [Devriesea agamarum]
MPRVILAIVIIALTIYAIADCASTDDTRIKGLPKFVWLIVIALVPVAGPIAWILVGKDRSIAGVTGVRRELRDELARRREATRRRRPMAPDEDPEFLRKLDEDIRRRRREQQRKEQPDENPRGEHPRHDD